MNRFQYNDISIYTTLLSIHTHLWKEWFEFFSVQPSLTDYSHGLARGVLAFKFSLQSYIIFRFWNTSISLFEQGLLLPSSHATTLAVNFYFRKEVQSISLKYLILCYLNSTIQYFNFMSLNPFQPKLCTIKYVNKQAAHF